MTDQRFNNSLGKLSNALDRLAEILDEPLDEKSYLLDATIQRYEFCIELTWKTLKHLIALKGKEVTFPKECLQYAYKAGWIVNEELWLKMLKDRNLTSHTYEETTAMEIYQHIKTYYPAMRTLFETIKNVKS